MQFNKDVVARIVAEAINEVLKNYQQPHMVDGVAVLPAGDSCLIDVVLLETTTRGTWAVSFFFHHSDNQVTGKRMDQTDFWIKEFPITSITRADLLSHRFKKEQVAALTDKEMERMASKMEDLYCDNGFWEDLEVCAERMLGLELQEEEVAERGESLGTEPP
jgi:hypothetical protein